MTVGRAAEHAIAGASPGAEDTYNVPPTASVDSRPPTSAYEWASGEATSTRSSAHRPVRSITDAISAMTLERARPTSFAAPHDPDVNWQMKAPSNIGRTRSGEGAFSSPCPPCVREGLLASVRIATSSAPDVSPRTGAACSGLGRYMGSSSSCGDPRGRRMRLGSAARMHSAISRRGAESLTRVTGCPRTSARASSATIVHKSLRADNTTGALVGRFGKSSVATLSIIDSNLVRVITVPPPLDDAENTTAGAPGTTAACFRSGPTVTRGCVPACPTPCVTLITDRAIVLTIFMADSSRGTTPRCPAVIVAYWKGPQAPAARSTVTPPC
eukprot:Opistho-1_new@61072